MTKAQAIKWAGSGAQLAKLLGIKPQAVYQWGNEVPKLRVYQIKELQNSRLELSKLMVL